MGINVVDQFGIRGYPISLYYSLVQHGTYSVAILLSSARGLEASHG